MSRDWTRRVLEIAAGPQHPEDVEHLHAALPEILARARRGRQAPMPATTLDVLVPLMQRWLPALAVGAASLALLAFLSQPATSEAWESSLLAQTADQAPAGDIVAEAIAGTEGP